MQWQKFDLGTSSSQETPFNASLDAAVAWEITDMFGEASDVAAEDYLAMAEAVSRAAGLTGQPPRSPQSDFWRAVVEELLRRACTESG